MSTQSTIDQLIQTINDAVTAGSVTNVMVATVMDFLNSRSKELAEDIQDRLSRTSPDTALGKIIFGNGAEYGEFVNSLTSGKGGAIDSSGNAQLESLEIRSYLKVLELVINRISVIGSEFYFTEGHTIEDVVEETNGTYTLRFKKNYDNELIEFQPYDVLKGIVNDLTHGNSHYTSWFRVNSVNQANYTVNVYLYPNDQVPSSVNYEPAPMMACKRWGNALAANEANHSAYPSIIEASGDGYVNVRQSCIYISSAEKRIVFLDGVTKPILDDGESGSNYAAFFGLPVSLYALRNVNLDPHQPYLYARGLFVQDMQQVTYNGTPKRGLTMRGQWSAETAEDAPYEYTLSNQDVVTHKGGTWGCLVTGTQDEPSYDSGDWLLMDEEPLHLNVDTEGYTELAYGEHLHVICAAMRGWTDVTDDVVRWTVVRDSGDEADDAAWLLRPKVRNFDGEIDIYHDSNPSIDDLGNVQVQGTQFTFTAYMVDDSLTQLTMII